MKPIALVLMVGGALAGCHAHEVRGDKSVADKASEKESDKGKEGDGKSQGSGGSAAQGGTEKAPRARQISSARPVRTTPAGFFDPEAVRKLQAALGKHGHSVEVTGQLDSATQAAILKFQKENSQPATGFPDFDTISRLGLSPQEIYLHQKNGEQHAQTDGTTDSSAAGNKAAKE